MTPLRQNMEGREVHELKDSINKRRDERVKSVKRSRASSGSRRHIMHLRSQADVTLDHNIAGRQASIVAGIKPEFRNRRS